MKCDKCKKNEANIHYEENINGKVLKINLCEKCMKDLELNIFDDFSFEVSNKISNAVEEKRCPKCGQSYKECISTSKFGCSECYDTFYKEIGKLLTKIHGVNNHVGKRMNITADMNSNSLNEQLEQAIKEERYEDAAVIRDKIAERRK